MHTCALLTRRDIGAAGRPSLINHRARWLIRCKARRLPTNGSRPGADGRPISARDGERSAGVGGGEGGIEGVRSARPAPPPPLLLLLPPRLCCCTARRQSDGMMGHFWADPLCTPTTGVDRNGPSLAAPGCCYYGALCRCRVGMLIS